MRPLSADDPFIEDLTLAVAQARAKIHVTGSPPPTAAELAALCNTALRLCVGRYEGEPLFTTLLFFGGGQAVHVPGFVPFVAGPDWRALARGFPEGFATRVEGGELRPFAGLTMPLSDTSADSLPVTRALVLPGVVGVTMGGELLAELRPRLAPEVLAVPRISLEHLLRGAGLPDDALLRPSHLRRLLRAARQHRHGASVIITASHGLPRRHRRSRGRWSSGPSFRPRCASRASTARRRVGWLMRSGDSRRSMGRCSSRSLAW
jgi:hypothetical protein